MSEQTINESALERLLHAMWATPAGQGRQASNLFLWGPPGIGKTLRAVRAARTERRHMEVVLLSVREPSDLVGMPFLTKAGVELQAPAWARRIVDAHTRGQKSVLFVDEFNCGAPLVQAAFLRVANERMVADLPLPDDCAIVAAANPPDQGAAAAHDLALATSNRWVHHDVTLDVSEWIDHMLSDGGDAGVDYSYMGSNEERWRGIYAEERGLVTAFLGRRPELALSMPKEDDPQASRGWASPRSWEQFARARAGARFHALGPDTRDTLCVGCVGSHTTEEFIKWLGANDLPDMAAVLDGTIKWTPDRRLDRTWAVMSAGAALVAPPTAVRRKERCEVLWSMVAGIAQTTVDVVVPCSRTLVKSRLHIGSPAATKALALIQPVLEAAGVRA